MEKETIYPIVTAIGQHTFKTQEKSNQIEEEKNFAKCSFTPNKLFLWRTITSLFEKAFYILFVFKKFQEESKPPLLH